MEKSDHAFRATARRSIDQLDAFPFEASQRRGEVVHDEADVVERRPSFLRNEAADPRVGVHGLYELEQLPHPAEEHDSDALVRELTDIAGAQPERVAKEWQRVFQSRHSDRDVMQGSERRL